MSNLSTPKEISPSSSFSTLPSSESPKTSVANLQANVLKNETKDASTPGEKVKTPTQSSQRKKTFTGCWTCRNRKVKCDLGRPQCNRCLKSKIKCEGYDIKLRWSTKSEKDPDEEYFQRRNIGRFLAIFTLKLWSLLLLTHMFRIRSVPTRNDVQNIRRNGYHIGKASFTIFNIRRNKSFGSFWSLPGRQNASQKSKQQ